MEKVTVDLTNCCCLDDLHQRFKEALGFPEYYGNNLSAFWDCLNRDCAVNSVSVIGSESIADDLKPTMEKIAEMLEENRQYWADSEEPFFYEIIG